MINPIDDISHSVSYLKEASDIIAMINTVDCEDCVEILAATRSIHGRVFVLGVGGSAANASHAVNDFRKIAGIEAYAPTDNVSELTARTNDEGWHTTFAEWLKVSHLNHNDTILVLSVGGGCIEKNISLNLVEAMKWAKQVGAKIIGIVGKEGGTTAKLADACVIIPTINANNVTPHSEAFQAVIWHMWVSHPALKVHQTKWESTNR